MQKIYTIDESRIINIQKRAATRSGLIMLFVLLITSKQLWNVGVQTGNYAAMLFLPLLLILPIWMGVRQIKQRYKTFQILIDDAGIQSQSQMGLFKRVEWDNAIITERKNGFVYVEDKNVSSFMRWWNGSGRIFIFPEIIDRDDLIDNAQKLARGY